METINLADGFLGELNRIFNGEITGDTRVHDLNKIYETAFNDMCNESEVNGDIIAAMHPHDQDELVKFYWQLRIGRDEKC